jgi:hypothetical protein
VRVDKRSCARARRLRVLGWLQKQDSAVQGWGRRVATRALGAQRAARRGARAAGRRASVPAMPMARPTSLSFRAGASLVPSPVTATTSPPSFSSLTSVSLSSGEERARTCGGGVLFMGWVFLFVQCGRKGQK